MPQNEKTRSLCILTSWLAAVDVPTQPATNADLQVICKDGSALPVVITADIGAHPRASRCVVVCMASLQHPAMERRLAALWAITEAAGYGRPKPVDRGAIPSRRLTIDDDFELVTMRHAEFRRAPNVLADQLGNYKTVLDVSVNQAFRRYRFVWDRYGMEVSDLRSWGLVWAISWLSEYSIPGPNTLKENQRLLYTRLWQRYAQLADATSRKMANTHPDVRGAIPENNIPMVQVPHHMRPSLQDLEPTGEVNNRKCSKKPKSATRCLDDALEALGHDQAIEVLRQAANNPFLDYEARKEATRRLRRHVNGCSECDTATTADG